MAKKLILLFLVIGLLYGGGKKSKIDRKSLVHRHFPVLTKPDPLSPFTVGNGEFAFTTDVTGLQTFPDFYAKGIPLCTLSNWGWHTIPDGHLHSLEETFVDYDTYGRKVKYAVLQDSEPGQWLRANPHRFHLGRIGFLLLKSDSTQAKISDLYPIHQVLDLWDGTIQSEFYLENEKVLVETACHPHVDAIGVRISSSLLKHGRIGILLAFPYGSPSWGPDPADWNHPEKHRSILTLQIPGFTKIERIMDSTRYEVHLQWYGKAQLIQKEPHTFLLQIQSGNSFECSVGFFSHSRNNSLPKAKSIFKASQKHWWRFWKTGGAVDFSQCTDPRAKELERRVILSRYLTAIQSAASLPPQETGLTCNSWHGKFHLEMHWWHGVHFVLWGHPELFEKSLPWYGSILSSACKEAERQGYHGVRWPKMVGPDGRESPSMIGVFLIWQQPHPIYYAELLYQIGQNPRILLKYKDIVFSTAEFLASYVHWDSVKNRYVLGPPLIPAQEIYAPENCINPTFELAYWAFGLKTAQLWRKRHGLPLDSLWEKVLQHLSSYPIRNGLYQNAENAIETFENPLHRKDHPSLLGAYGMLPGENIDPKLMEKTLEAVLQSWNWESTWGWDYPLMAMTAARIGRPDLAIEALLMKSPKNQYLANGHNYQGPSLPVYLPGNGALLTAVAMMARGWKEAPQMGAPGFPQNGQWNIRYEKLVPLL